MCKKEYDAMQEALEDYGSESNEYIEARGRYLVCYGQLMQARDAHAAAWDERLYQLQKEIRQAWERLTGKLKIPPLPTCGGKSLEARYRIFATKRNAMVFSEKLEEAFKETGVKLDDGETYACLVCVVKKPQYVSEALTVDPLSQNVEGASRINYILEPAIMNSVMNAMEQDTIDYKPNVK